MNPGKTCQVRWAVLLSLAVVVVFVPVCTFAQTTTPATNTSPAPVPLVANPCSRFTAGSAIHNPPALFSQNGVLNVQFSYQTTTDLVGRQLYCFMTPSGLENPTLHVNPGDTLNITVTNNTPYNEVGDPDSDEPFNPPNCGDAVFELQNTTTNSQGYNMTGGSMNIHYHGTNTSPGCHGDNVTKTLVNPSLAPGSPASTFQYNIHFPTNEPPGLYWYHPHVHMLAEAAVFGGASGALIVDGINNVQPAVGGLSERIIVLRDLPFNVPGISETCCNSTNALDGQIPQRDLSVNFVPLDTTVNLDSKGNLINVNYTPAVIHMQAGEQQFWRVCNCNSDAPMDLQVRFDGTPQTIQIVGIDAVPVNSQDGTGPGQLIPVTHFRIPPASRVEFIVNAPPSSVQLAQLVTQFIYSGPIGDTLPTRPLLTMKLGDATEAADNRVPPSTRVSTNHQMFGGISSVNPALTRTVYFEEYQDGSAFFVNASGCVTSTGAQCPTQPYPTDTPFDNNNPPAFITTQGTVEKWIVQNHANENHELHQHQVHFKVLSQDNFDANCIPVGGTGNCGIPNAQTCQTCAPAINGQFLDMIEIPYCGGDPAGPPNIVNGKPVGPPIPAACLTTKNGTGPPIPYPQVQLLVDFRGPTVGDFVFHCHILGHEDLGMMAIEHVRPADE